MLEALASPILIVYPLLCVMLCMAMPVRKAATIGLIAGYLFLPQHAVELPALMSYSKPMAAVLGPLLGVLVFEPKWFTRLRFKWLDAVVLLFCVSPFITSVAPANLSILGPYEGVSASIIHFSFWGLPYLLGRAIYCDREGLRLLATGIFMGGLIYMPLCLFEIRMSPVLHSTIWGYFQHGWSGKRLGGYRPSVFMEHGMELGLWMSTACVVGTVLVWSKSVRVIASLPAAWWLAALFIVTILCRSSGALVLMLMALGTLYMARNVSLKVPLLILALLGPGYITVRVLDIWDGSHAVVLAEKVFGHERASSYDFRLENERILADHAMKRPLVGWGRMYNRARPYTDRNYGDRRAIMDGLWVVMLPTWGILAMISIYTLLSYPLIRIGRGIRPKMCLSKSAGPALGLALVVMMYMLDSLVNAPIMAPLIAAAAGLAVVPIRQLNPPRVRAKRPAKPPRRLANLPA